MRGIELLITAQITEAYSLKFSFEVSVWDSVDRDKMLWLVVAVRLYFG